MTCIKHPDREWARFRSVPSSNHAVRASLSDFRRRHTDLESLTNRGFLVSRNVCGRIYRDHYWLVVCAMEKSSVDLNFSHRKKSEAATKKHSRGQVIFFSRVVSHPSQLERLESSVSFKSHRFRRGMIAKIFLCSTGPCVRRFPRTI